MSDTYSSYLLWPQITPAGGNPLGSSTGFSALDRAHRERLARLVADKSGPITSLGQGIYQAAKDYADYREKQELDRREAAYAQREADRFNLIYGGGTPTAGTPTAGSGYASMAPGFT